MASGLWEHSVIALQQSPLHAQHAAANAKLADFAGWELPLNYESGALAEHQACRQNAAAFDVSHLGTLEVKGPGVFDALQWCFSNDLRRISPGEAQYTHLLDPVAGWVIDDVIIWWVGEADFRVLPNAANTQVVAEVLLGCSAEASQAGLSEAKQWRLSVQDITQTRALIALQGPNARQLLQAVSEPVAQVGRFAVAGFEFAGMPCYVAGTGYTGEDGVECEVPAEVAPEFWNRALELGFAPAGLAARDLLRLEAGFPLHGHDLGPGITPLNARLNWVVGWKKTAFRGLEPLVSQKDQGVGQHLLGLVAQGRRPLRDKQPVLLAGEPVGEITSGGYSPVLERGIALAMLLAEVPLGAQVTVSDKQLAAEVVKPPFVPLG